MKGQTANQSLLTLAPVERLWQALRGLNLFDAHAPVTLARAPGRLDVMGGIADYTGSLVCEMPLAIAAAAAVQAREDGRLVLYSAQRDRTVTVPASVLADADPATLAAQFDGDDDWARYIAGCAWWLWHHDASAVRDTLRQGLSIAVDSDVPLGGGVSSSAAIEVASMSALCGALDVSLPPMRLAAACQQVENQVVGAPCGVMDQMTAALGESNAMLALLCQPDGQGLPAQLEGEITVPAGYAFVGVHSGVEHEVRGDPYTDTRTAAFMGQKILASLKDGPAPSRHLANMDADAFSAQWRAQLPETITGRAFLDQFGDTDDPVTQVRADKTYAVRAAVTHHVLEAQRVRRFVNVLREANAADDETRDALIQQAGELMVASHHSYGENAHLGHEATDRLVELVREQGPANGFYGAKITGGGCGGTVAMLVRDADKQTQTLDALRQRYVDETGRATTLVSGTSPGAAAAGTSTRRLDEDAS